MKKLSLLIAVISMFFMVSCGSSTTNENKSDEDTKIVEASFEVSGNCGMCKDRIEKAAISVDGVETAVWNKDTKQMKITHKKSIEVEAVQKAIADAGHDTEMYEAKEEVYSNLPDCCLYRDGNSHTEDGHEGHNHD